MCACAALYNSAEALQLSEGLLRFLAAPDRDVGPLGRGAAASSAAAGEPPRPTSAASGAASFLPAVGAFDLLVLFMFMWHTALPNVAYKNVCFTLPLSPDAERAELAASAEADELSLEVEHADAAPAAAAGTEPGPLAGGTQLAVTAVQGLPTDALLGLAQGAARLHAPLTAALAVERLRRATHVAPKEEFAEMATQVRLPWAVHTLSFYAPDWIGEPSFTARPVLLPLSIWMVLWHKAVLCIVKTQVLSCCSARPPPATGAASGNGCRC